MAIVTETQLERCIDGLYGALTDPETLVDAIRTIRLTFGASGATHLHFNPKGELTRFVDDGHDSECQRRYVDHYMSLDPTRVLLNLPAGEWLRDDSLLDPRRTPSREFVNDFAKSAQFRWFLGCRLFENEGGMATFSLQRGRDASPFDNETFALMSQLQPHLKRVFRMMIDVAPLIPALTSANAAMDMLRVPVCVVDGESRIVYANPAAEDMFAKADAIKVVNGRLLCRRAEANDMLLRAVMLASRYPAQASAFSPEPHESPVKRLQIRAVPLAQHIDITGYGSGRLVLLFFATGSGPLQIEELQQMFGFTRAEAELVSMLAQGISLEHCATRRGVSITTVRTQLASIYTKTGAGSQAQLLSIVLALPALRTC